MDGQETPDLIELDLGVLCESDRSFSHPPVRTLEPSGQVRAAPRPVGWLREPDLPGDFLDDDGVEPPPHDLRDAAGCRRGRDEVARGHPLGAGMGKNEAYGATACWRWAKTVRASSLVPTARAGRCAARMPGPEGMVIRSSCPEGRQLRL